VYVWLRSLGYSRWVDEPSGFVFWRLHRPVATSASNQKPPNRALVFISGLGIGQAVYPHHAYTLAHDPALSAYYTDICLAELPGVSGTPLRHDRTFPTAQQAVEAFERFARHVCGTSSLDAIGHSAGALVLSCTPDLT
jgi:pimeloyl-ACP methyl ester carboxylesterase